jgi:hypothetical protein
LLERQTFNEWSPINLDSIHLLILYFLVVEGGNYTYSKKLKGNIRRNENGYTVSAKLTSGELVIYWNNI